MYRFIIFFIFIFNVYALRKYIPPQLSRYDITCFYINEEDKVIVSRGQEEKDRCFIYNGLGVRDFIRKSKDSNYKRVRFIQLTHTKEYYLDFDKKYIAIDTKSIHEKIAKKNNYKDIDMIHRIPNRRKVMLAENMENHNPIRIEFYESKDYIGKPLFVMDKDGIYSPSSNDKICYLYETLFNHPKYMSAKDVDICTFMNMINLSYSPLFLSYKSKDKDGRIIFSYGNKDLYMKIPEQFKNYVFDVGSFSDRANLIWKAKKDLNLSNEEMKKSKLAIDNFIRCLHKYDSSCKKIIRNDTVSNLRSYYKKYNKEAWLSNILKFEPKVLSAVKWLNYFKVVILLEDKYFELMIDDSKNYYVLHVLQMFRVFSDRRAVVRTSRVDALENIKNHPIAKL